MHLHAAAAAADQQGGSSPCILRALHTVLRCSVSRGTPAECVGVAALPYALPPCPACCRPALPTSVHVCRVCCWPSWCTTASSATRTGEDVAAVRCVYLLRASAACQFVDSVALLESRGQRAAVLVQTLTYCWHAGKGWSPRTPRRTLDDQHNVAAGIQDFLICIEMFFAALAHAYAFPPRVSMARSEGWGRAVWG